MNADTRYQLTLSNSSSDPLYCYLFGFDAQPNALMIYRSETIMDNDSERTVLNPFMVDAGSELILPSETEEFGMSGPSGLGSLYLLMTRDRLPQLDKAIDQATKTASKGSQAKQIKISDPVILREALLTDLAGLSQSTPKIDLFEEEKYWTLSLNTWAMMRFCLSSNLGQGALITELNNPLLGTNCI